MSKYSKITGKPVIYFTYGVKNVEKNHATSYFQFQSGGVHYILCMLIFLERKTYFKLSRLQLLYILVNWSCLLRSDITRVSPSTSHQGVCYVHLHWNYEGTSTHFSTKKRIDHFLNFILTKSEYKVCMWSIKNIQIEMKIYF